MKIKRVILKNYRQYKELDFVLPEDKRIMLLIGKNGTGKSNFLNAINWCLYEKEPFGTHVAGLPSWFKKCKKGEKVEVEIQISDDEETVYSIQRSLRIGNDNSELAVLIKDITSEDWEPMPNPRNIISRLLPEEVSNFFLFDGEHITNIFASRYGESIQEGINRVSQIEILDRAIDHLQTIEDLYRKEVTRGIPDTEQYDNAIKVYRSQITEDEEALRNNKGKIKDFREQREKFKSKQKDIDEAKALRITCDKVERHCDSLREEMDSCKKEINDLLYDVGPYVFIIDELNSVKKAIDSEREKGIIPPDIRPQLIKDLIELEECICGRKIDKGSREFKKLTDLLNKFDIADKKSFFEEGSFVIDAMLNTKITRFSEKVKGIKKRYLEKKDSFEKSQKELKEYSDRLKKDFGEIVGNIENTINDISDQIEELERKNGALETNISIRNGKLNECIATVESMMRNKTKSAKDADLYGKTKKLLNIVTEIKKNVVSRVREIVVEKTNENFKNLCWKKDFNNINVSSGYELEVRDRAGVDIFGSLSTGERKILGLSFLGALSTVSGFNAPILIDNPFGMLDKEVQESLASRLRNYLPGKQLFLFSLDSHITDEVEKILKQEKKEISKYILSYSNETTDIEEGD